MTQFIIEKNGVYYLTVGKMFVYDENAAKNDKQKEGVANVRRRFKEERDKPHTFYEAVELTGTQFSPLNTGEIS